MATWHQTADFEENDLSDFDATDDADNKLTVGAAAARNGSFGMIIDPEGTATIAYGELAGPTDDVEMSCETWLRISPLTMANGDSMQIMQLLMDTGSIPLILELNCDGTGKYIRIGSYDDGDNLATGAAYYLSSGWYRVTIVLKVATAPGANNGYARMLVNYRLKGGITGIDNDTREVDKCRYGTWYADAGSTGTFHMDDCRWADEIVSPRSFNRIMGIIG